jgi:hypothetical protein
MKRTKETPNTLPQHDYGVALQTAVSWLGDRYVLAEPVARRAPEYRPFYAQPRRWLDVPRPRALRH